MLEDKNAPIKWATMVPLIGGSAFGCYNATGTKPQYNMSYTPFAANEKFYYRYWDDIPIFLIDEGNDPNEEHPEYLDFVNSVCPCAGLSQLSTAKSGSNARANQNKWMFESAEYVLDHIQPKVYWGENAPALFTNSGRDVREQLIEIAKKHDYSFSLYKTSTSLHGAPQFRNRTFYFFWDSETAPIMNWYQKPLKPLAEFLNSFPKGLQGENEPTCTKDLQDDGVRAFVLAKEKRIHSEFIKQELNQPKVKNSYFRWIELRNMFDEAIQWVGGNPQFGTSHRSYRQLVKAKSKLDAGKNYMAPGPYFFGNVANAMVGRTIGQTQHPVEERYLNIREIMHLMGMPTDFEFSAHEPGAALNMLAQNVPVWTAQDMAAEVVKYCRGNLQTSQKKVLFQNNFKQKYI
jgi:site-specific DNA-cytosine methylase